MKIVPMSGYATEASHPMLPADIDKNLKLNARISSQQETIRQLHSEINDLTLKNEEEQKKLRLEREFMQSSQAFTRARFEELQRMVLEHSQLATHLKKENEKLSTTLGQLRASLAAQKSHYQAHYQEQYTAQLHAQLRARTQAESAKCAALQKTIAELEQKNKRTLSPDIENLTIQLENEREEKNMLLALVRTLEVKLSRATAQAEDLSSRLNTLAEPYLVTYPEETIK